MGRHLFLEPFCSLGCLSTNLATPILSFTLTHIYTQFNMFLPYPAMCVCVCVCVCVWPHVGVCVHKLTCAIGKDRSQKGSNIVEQKPHSLQVRELFSCPTNKSTQTTKKTKNTLHSQQYTSCCLVFSYHCLCK